MITKFGKRFLTSYLSGNESFLNKELAFGIGSTTPNAKGNDTKLEFEFYRIPVELSSFNVIQNGVDNTDLLINPYPGSKVSSSFILIASK